MQEEKRGNKFETLKICLSVLICLMSILLSILRYAKKFHIVPFKIVVAIWIIVIFNLAAVYVLEIREQNKKKVR